MQYFLPQKYGAWLTINRSCNLRCSWCYAKSKNFATSSDISFEKVKEISYFLKQLPVSKVVLIGGEPTIHQDFFKILQFLKSSGFHTSVVTNAIMLEDASFLKSCIESGLDGALVSIKAGSDEGYREMANVLGAFDKVTKAIRNLVSAGLPHSICFTMCEGNFHQFDKILEAVKELRVNKFIIDTERPVLIDEGTQTPYTPDCNVLANLLMSIHPKLEASGLDFTMKISIPFCNFTREFIEMLLKKEQIHSGCQIYGGKGIIFDTDGKLLACNQICENPLGEIGVDFNDAESYSEFRKREDIANFYECLNDYPDERCCDCQYWQYCGGGCVNRWLFSDATTLLGNFQLRERGDT